jgi:uncharacterized protein (DUF2062 family)
MQKKRAKKNQYHKGNKIFLIFLKAYERFLKIRGEPREIALGFALGIFVGITPTLGSQMVIAAFLAAIFKWSKISAAMGVWITTPVTAPFIYGSTYVVGSKVLELFIGHPLPIKFKLREMTEMLSKAPEIFLALTIGGILLGLPLAVVSYYLSYFVIQRYRKNIKKTVVKRVKKLKSLNPQKGRKRKRR